MNIEFSGHINKLSAYVGDETAQKRFTEIAMGRCIMVALRDGSHSASGEAIRLYLHSLDDVRDLAKIFADVVDQLDAVVAIAKVHREEVSR